MKNEMNEYRKLPKGFQDKLNVASNHLNQWYIKPSHNLSMGEVFVAFSFGFGPSRDEVSHSIENYHPLIHKPGISNEDLADVIISHLDYRGERNFPIFTQWEIGEALRDKGVEINEGYVARPLPNEYLSTRGVVDQALDNGLGKFRDVIVVGHPDHIYRCLLTTKKAFKDRELDPNLYVPDVSKVRYDPESVQPWTRDRESYLMHDLRGRLRGMAEGWIPLEEKLSLRRKIMDCRVCKHFAYQMEWRDEYFKCKKGYFDIEDKGEIKGKSPEKGSIGGEYPCGGDDFEYNPRSRWAKL